MRRLIVPLAAACLLATACAQPAGDGSAAGADPAALAAWADDVADAWSASGDKTAWTTGFVPLQDLAAVDGALDPAGERAFTAGWVRTGVALPAATPPPGVVRFGAATLDVPLMSAADAYAQLRQGGEPPPCPASSAPPSVPPPSASAAGPDTAVSSDPVDGCGVPTVTGATLGTTEVRTTRGVATVPAWRFAVEGSPAVLVRVAVAPSALAPLPAPAPTPTDRAPNPQMVAAQHLTAVEGTRLAYALGVGACDEDIEPVVAERPDVVVVGGGVRRAAGVCTEQLLLHEVSVRLDRPLGDRPVFDALTGQPLILTGG